ncbi:MAG: response regulator [Candidatus Omnitrophica bacterium]|nr:response regulator [Candidatus Omnitrophota bacterium]MBU4479550.1 response regulator [Candidatus Omnitrophota bacterium]MCG2702893.1 response regulator [Candidatus Omnitrophota bacterium]
MPKECKKSILVVEDNRLNMKLVVDLLGVNGFNVLQAVDGESAIEIMKTTVPDLILLDIQLPGIDGFEVLKRIKENKQLDAAKVVALTAQVMREEMERISNVEFDAYLTKPINTKDFIIKIKTMLL